MPECCILHPIEEGAEGVDLKKLRAKYKEVRDAMNTHTLETDTTFEEFLEELDLSLEEYKQVVASSLRKVTLFLKREPNEVFINAYNKDILEVWQANMDIQFVLDEYAAASYITSYIMKSERGVSEMMKEACEFVKRGEGMNVVKAMRHVGNAFLRGSEISAQEAAYHVLGLRMKQSSRVCEFINTGCPSERMSRLKNPEQMEFLPDDSLDVVCLGNIGRYLKRMFTFSLPDHMVPRLQNMCLAEFVAMYEWKPSKAEESIDIDAVLDDEIEENPVDAFQRAMQKNGMYLRRKPKIVRWIGFKKVDDEEKFYKEQLMLFLPWEMPKRYKDIWNDETEETFLLQNRAQGKAFEQALADRRRRRQRRQLWSNFLHPVSDSDEDEAPDLDDPDVYATYQEKYMVHQIEILQNKSKYRDLSVDWDALQADVENGCAKEVEDYWEEYAPNTCEAELADFLADQIPETFLDQNLDGVFDLARDFEISVGSNVCEDFRLLTLRNKMPDEEYRAMVRKLNTEQRRYFDHFQHQLRHHDGSIYEFLTGGAGVGKSLLTRCIIQAADLYFGTSLNSDATKGKVLVLAPTGTAAFQVRGPRSIPGYTSIPTSPSHIM